MLTPCLLAVAAAFTLPMQPVGADEAPKPPEVVSPGGKGTYLTGPYVLREDPENMNDVINLPIGGRVPIVDPQQPVPYIGEAKDRAPVTNRWWQALNLGPYGTQLTERNPDGSPKMKKVKYWDGGEWKEREEPVYMEGETDFTNYVVANPLTFLARRDGLAFASPEALFVSPNVLTGVHEAWTADKVRPGQAPDLEALDQVIVSTTAVANRRTLGKDWRKEGLRWTEFNVSDFSDWWVETTFGAEGDHSMVTSFAAGSPLVYGKVSEGDTAEVSINNWAVQEMKNEGPMLVFQITKGVDAGTYEGGVIPVDNQIKQIFAFYGEPGSTWKKQEPVEGAGTVVYTNTFEKQPERETYFAGAVLPTADLAEEYRKYSMSPVTDSKVTPKLQKSAGTLTADYEVTAKVLDVISDKSGYEEGTVLALFQHHYRQGLGDGYTVQFNGKFLKDPLNSSTDAIIPGLRGPMKLLAGTGFQQKFKIPQIKRALAPSKGIKWFDAETPERKILERFLDPAVIAKNDYDYEAPKIDTYNSGKRMAKYAAAAAIAGAVGSDHREALLARANKFLTGIDADHPEGSPYGWFIATNAEDKPKDNHGNVFWYDDTWKTIIGYPTGYGSGLNINDHHFHYGYFLRTAAEIVRDNPEWKEDWGPMVEVLMDDVMRVTRDDGPPAKGPHFPFIRQFDPWYGHSCATGVNNMPADGPDQESTSEAFNAWTGIYLWAQATNDLERETWAAFIAASELRAARMYWFDVDGKTWRNRAESFENLPTFVIVYANKFSTTNWFNLNWSTRVGIEILPQTGNSIYHGEFPEAVARTINLWAPLQGIDDVSDIEQWKKPTKKVEHQDYVYWAGTWFAYFALSSDPKHVAFAKKVITPSEPGGEDSILETWEVTGTRTEEKGQVFDAFDQGNSKANVYWFIQNAKANLNGQTVAPKDAD